MKKEEVFVRINTPEEAKEVVRILEEAGERIYNKEGVLLWNEDEWFGLEFTLMDGWSRIMRTKSKEITIQKLQHLLSATQSLESITHQIEQAAERASIKHHWTKLMTDHQINSVLVEEIGEISKSLNDNDGRLKEELLDAAAVIYRWIERIEKGGTK